MENGNYYSDKSEKRFESPRAKGGYKTRRKSDLERLYPDQDDEFHINTFETSPSQRAEVEQYISSFVDNADLGDTIFLKS